MTDTEEHDLDFKICSECGRLYFLASTTNVRNGKMQVIPLEVAPDDVQGNFTVEKDNLQLAKDLAMNDIGPYPFATYGQGDYVPHNPSHFTGEPHMDDDLHALHVAEEPYHGRE